MEMWCFYNRKLIASSEERRRGSKLTKHDGFYLKFKLGEPQIFYDMKFNNRNKRVMKNES